MALTEADVVERLSLIFSNLFPEDFVGCEGFSMESVLSWNSLTHMELVVQISQQFGLGRLSTDEILALDSFQQARRFICLRLEIRDSDEPN